MTWAKSFLGTVERPQPEDEIAKWRAMILRHRREEAAYGHDNSGPKYEAWMVFVADWTQRGSIGARLQAINDYANALPDFEDTSDYWRSPGDTLMVGGDCEDKAILKFFSARMLVPSLKPGNLRLVIVKDPARPRGNRDHAIIVVRPKARWLAYDNLARFSYSADRRRNNYRVVASMDETTLWRHKLPK